MPLVVEFTEVGEAELDSATAFMVRFGADVAERWISNPLAVIDREADLLSLMEIRRPAPPPSERVVGLDLRTLLYQTLGGSAWHIFFTLDDMDDDGVRDTLRVHRVRHAARQTETPYVTIQQAITTAR